MNNPNFEESITDEISFEEIEARENKRFLGQFEEGTFRV